MVKRSILVLLLVVSSIGLMTGVASASPQAMLLGCKGDTDPTSLTGARTMRTAGPGAYGTLELRADGTDNGHCWWGRISNARNNDSVWIDVAYSLADAANGEWFGPRGKRWVVSGTGQYSLAYNPLNAVRACGAFNGAIRCTSWYGL